MSPADLIKKKAVAFHEICVTYNAVTEGRYFNVNTVHYLYALNAMHEACCRELMLVYAAERSDGIMNLVAAALDELSSFVKEHHDTNVHVRAAIAVLRQAARKGGAA